MQSKHVSIETMMPMISECLTAGQSVLFSPQGISMKPMLRPGIDRVLLSPVPERLKKYDLVLYKRANGQYILHRIIKAGLVYHCRGDHQFKPEHGLKQDQMIAVVTGFYRGNKLHRVNEIGYRLYCRIWCGLRTAQWFLYRVCCRIKRGIRKNQV